VRRNRFIIVRRFSFFPAVFILAIRSPSTIVLNSSMRLFYFSPISFLPPPLAIER